MTTNTWVNRRESAEDILVVRDITVAAFDTADEADLVDALRRGPAWIDDFSIVTVDDTDTAIGHALLTRSHIGDTPVLTLAPCSVAPQHQNRGAGSAAIRAALDAARVAGEHAVTVLGHPDYYPRFGFERASLHSIRMNVEVPDDALMILALDDRPLPSGVIRYADAFGDI